MKRLFFLIIILFMACSLPACSKSKKNNQNEAKPAAAKNVDLGETTPKPEDSADAGNKSKRQKPSPGRDGSAKTKAEKDAPAKADGTENKDADAPNPDAPNADAPNADAPKDDKPAEAPEMAKDGNDAKNVKDGADKKDNADEKEGFDFADEDPAPPPEVRRPKPRVGLDIEKLINIRELREQTNYAGALQQAWLLGQEPDSRYNAMRLATDSPKDLGFAIQVWKPGNESAASKRFNDLFDQSFGGKKIKNVATDAYTASHHDINELGFFEKSKRAAVLLSCSNKVCTADQLKEIALIIQRRL